jgi:(2R)-sulfolactate sulfo-lyase subunit alpha
LSFQILTFFKNLINLSFKSENLLYKNNLIFYKEIVTMANTDIIIHDEKDNVGVVVIDKTSKNQDCNCWVMENDKSVSIKSLNEIPLGHKIAMIDLNEGDTILKYGHDIGKVVKSIKKGEHVHVHNVKTKKW